MTVRSQIELPKLNRPESLFAFELGQAIAPTNKLFHCNGRQVEIINEGFSGFNRKTKLAYGGVRFELLGPIRAQTWFEQFAEIGQMVYDAKGPAVFMAKTMSKDLAGVVLQSPQFIEHLPRVSRILPVPIPILTLQGDIVFPKPGFNPDLELYCNPGILDPKPIAVDEAQKFLTKIFDSFCWKNEQSKTHALARFLTPYFRGIIGFDERIPLWLYLANRPRAGKDYFNGVVQLVFLGGICEDHPLTRGQEHETWKRIVSAARAGRSQMHFANCQGKIDDAAFIWAVTAPSLGARSLGGTEAKSDIGVPNEIEYSLSANIDTEIREDIYPRSRLIEFEYFDENPNDRKFPDPFLHDWVKVHRLELLQAVKSFFNHWLKKGMPSGAYFNSFPRWGQVIGGVMETCGLGNPCANYEDDNLIGGDMRRKAIRVLFNLCYKEHPDEWIASSDIWDVLVQNQPKDDRLNWFGDLDRAHSAKSKLGRALTHYRNQIIDGLRLSIDTSMKNSSRWQYYFEKVKPAP